MQKRVDSFEIDPFEIDISFTERCSLGEIRSGEARLLKSITIRNIRGVLGDWLTVSASIGGKLLINKRLKGYTPGEENRSETDKLFDKSKGLFFPRDLTPGPYTVTLKLNTRFSTVEKSFDVDVLDREYIPVSFDKAKYLAAWVQQYDHLRAIVEHESLSLRPEEKLKFIYNALSSRNLSYKECPQLIYPDYQEISRYDHISNHGGNCAELSLLIASMLYCDGAYPALLLFKDHMAAGCLVNPDSYKFVTLDVKSTILSLVEEGKVVLTDSVGVCCTCRQDYEQAKASVIKRLQRDDSCVLINVIQALRYGGVKPIDKYAEKNTVTCPTCGYTEITVSADKSEYTCPACGASITSPVKNDLPVKNEIRLMRPMQKEDFEPLRSYVSSLDYECSPAFGTKAKRHDILAVSFSDTLLDFAPSNAVDVSAGMDRSVCAWVRESCLIIAANGKIQLPKNSSDLFRGFCRVMSIDFGGLVSTAGVRNMCNMFNGCADLASLDVSGFDTSDVTDMSGMFGNCLALKDLDVSHFDTSNVSDMSEMFFNCYNLKSLDVVHFDTSNVSDMSGMFAKCSKLGALDVTRFDTSNVENMNGMFLGCGNLKSLDVSHFDTSNVENMKVMFFGCGNLKSLDVSHFDTSNVENMGGMFAFCEALEYIDISAFDFSKVVDKTGIFANNQKTLKVKGRKNLNS